MSFFRYTKDVKASRLEKVYFVLLAIIFGGIILHAPLSVGLGVLFPHFEVLIKSWKEILMAVEVPLAAVIITRRGMWRELTHDWLLWLIGFFALLNFVLVPVFYQGVAQTAAGLAIDLRYLLYFVLVYVALRILPQYRRWMVLIGLIGAFVVVGFAVVQLFLPPDILSHIGYGSDTIAPYLTVDKNPDYIRVNSTLRGPNPLGAYAVIVLGALSAALARGKLELHNKKVLAGTVVLAVCAAVALWISYSRSALVAGIMAVLIVLFAVTFRRLSKKAWIISAVIVCALAGGLVAAKGSTFVSNVILHENPNGGSSISSNDDHVTSLVKGWSQFVRQPFGAGVGSTGSASLYGGETEHVIENQYLFIAHESGWLGLLVFIALFMMIMARLWYRRSDWLALGVFASGVGLALIGLLLPVWVDDTVSIIWWGLAAIVLGGNYNAREQTE